MMPPPSAQAILITGGAGFIGTNLAHRLLSSGERVIILDNLAREGVSANAAWIRQTHGDRVRIELGDVRDAQRLDALLPHCKAVFHFAAQVAVTTSLTDPARDFITNLEGTFTLLEALRRHAGNLPLLFTSTNKVYGALDHIALLATGSRYRPESPAIARYGLSEHEPLDFQSPYGCSKGAADQYVLDYVRSYGMPHVVFRMSCIYGPHQFGNEDQGWVAHFLIRALAGEPITLYGDGCQVRDVLFVEDLVEALLRASAGAHALKGQVFNMGGGPTNAVSLLEVIEIIELLTGLHIRPHHEPWRVGDQRYYVADTRKFQRATGWVPRIGAREGIARLAEWLMREHPRAAKFRHSARSLEVAG